MASAIIKAEANILLGRFLALNLNSAGSDNEMLIPFSKYIVRRFIVTNSSTSLAASIATLGLFTAAAGGGTTIVTAGLLTTLTAASKFVDMVILETDDTLTASSLFARNVIAHGGAATVDVYVIGDVLT